jgi:glycosyltransferase involved in cell wall biosynthesis
MDRKRSVVYLVRPTSEQLQEHVISLATYLPRRYFDVTVVGDLDRPAQDILTRSSVRWAKVDLPVGRSWRRGDVARLGRLFEALRADLVHMHGYEVVGLGARASARLRVRPVLVYTAHELSGSESGALVLSWKARSRYRRLLSEMDLVITFSQRDRQALATISPEAAAHAEVIPPGIDTRRVRPLSNPGGKRRQLGLLLHSAVVGTVAQLEKHGGVDTFLAAAEIVSQELPNVEFAIVGEGALHEQFEQWAHRRGLTGSVTFLGRRWDLPEVLGTFNVVAVTTEAAGGVQTALQALALGIPVVATDTGGLREILGDLEDVPFVPPGDAEALAAAIKRHLETAVPRSKPAGGLITAEGLFMTERQMLVTTEAFDIDLPGVHPVERRVVRTPGAELARRYGVGRMIRHTTAVYRRLMGDEGETKIGGNA